MAIKAYKPVTNGRRNMTALTKDEITSQKPEKSLAVTIRVRSLLDIMVADIRENIELSISKEIKMVYLVRSLLSNTIQTVLQTSH